MSSSIDDVLRTAVEAGAVPNVVAVAADDSGIVYEGAAGPRSAGSPDLVGVDSVFRIASMTKIVTTVAALQQMERGALELDAPVDTYCPEFAETKVLEGFDGDQPRTRPARTRATIRHLLTHTSGLSYWFFNSDIVRWEAATGTPNALGGGDAYFNAPLVADPGTTFEYGINTDWLGRVVQVASGKTLDVYFREEILGPLGMNRTGFVVRPEDSNATVPIHVPGDGGTWIPTPIDLNQAPAYWPGGHGLYSTPTEYLNFQRMLLGRGSFNGLRLLQEKTVDAAFQNQIGRLDFPATITSGDPAAACDFSAGPDHKWGFGLLLNTTQQPGMRSPGSGGWAGLFNSHFWVDPAQRLTGAIYTQALPFALPASMDVYANFERALYASR